MTHQARTCIFVLALATAIGWYAGVALLPLAAWVVYEASLSAVRAARATVTRPL